MPQIPVDAGLVVFLRLPEKGKVKTRLAATLGEEAALEIYKKLVSITLDIVIRSEIPTYLFYTDGLPPASTRDARFSYHIQADGDLGSRMADALSFVLSLHQKALIIGSDCPGLTPEILHAGCRSLDEKDIVLGPADDGGYYLLGCIELHPALFANIKWSTPSVLDQTIEKIKEANLSYCLLEKLHDIDTAEDWNRFSGS
ncbi:MAG: TIGR04282 family arsenosugar biosynthesis glycosyltransferase [Saprospiraceae bacterium]|nr:TIGR04282 family arsenosugar biosynthesis glycosyltransferase [Candidatus Opimibacter skivensis]